MNYITALYIFPAADGLKKSRQLLIGLNEIHTVIPEVVVVKHVLQVVVVERVLHLQRFYPQYYCSQFVLLCSYTE